MPTIHTVDCSTGAAVEREMTPAEAIAYAAARATDAQREQRAAAVTARRAADLALLAQHPALDDGLKAALARLIGP